VVDWHTPNFSTIAGDLYIGRRGARFVNGRASTEVFASWDIDMSASEHREIACAIIIDTHRRFLLQQRDDVPGILCPGMVGLFGGHREGGETFLQCVVREVREETSYFVKPDRFEHLASYTGVDPDAEGGTLCAEFFVVRDVPSDALLIMEGSLLIAERDDLLGLRRLAPSAKFALSTFFDKRWRI
jgi:8-oxo-dGTP pyrophosphatase MutT (NUDIX family)